MRAWMLGGGAALLLACGGLDFSSPDLEDVSHAEAAAAGYSLPDGVSHIYLHDFSAIDVRSTYYRYTLTEASFAWQVEQFRASWDYTEHAQWRIPPSWPDYSGFGEEAAPPHWWKPTGDIVFQKVQSATLDGSGADMGSGSLTAFDEETHTVSIWQWQWQWWSAAPEPVAEPLIIALDEALGADMVELQCSSGYRQRRESTSGQAIFKDAPVQAECRLRVLGDRPRSARLPDGREVACLAEGDTMTCSAS